MGRRGTLGWDAAAAKFMGSRAAAMLGQAVVSRQAASIPRASVRPVPSAGVKR